MFALQGGNKQESQPGGLKTTVWEVEVEAGGWRAPS